MIGSKAKETAFVDQGFTSLLGDPLLKRHQLKDRMRLSLICQNFLVLTKLAENDNARATFDAVWNMFADKAGIEARSTASILEELRQHIIVYKSKLSMWSRLWATFEKLRFKEWKY